MSFTPEFLDELRARVPVSGVVGRKVKLIKRGREFSGLCPFHNEKSPSFTVNDDKGFYHCFGCGAHGDVITFVTETEGLTFPESVERLAEQAGLQVPKGSREDIELSKKRASLYDVMEEISRWFEEQLAAKGGQEARDYVNRRGLRGETVSRFRLGFAPNQRGLLRKAMNARGIGDEQLVDVGVIKPSEGGGRNDGDDFWDYFINRLMFPITDRRGRIIAFGGRALGESKAKYLNSPDTTLFHKGKVLYNLAYARQAAHDLGEVIVTEGYMDVIALSQAGFPAAVAPLGTAVTEDQIQELWRMVAEPTLCLDGDQAGIRAAYRVVERALPIIKPGKSLLFCTLPEGEDPDSLIQTQGATTMREHLSRARPLSEMLWKKTIEGLKLDTPERRAALKAELRKQISVITDKDLSFEYQKEMFRRYDTLTGGSGGASGQSAAAYGGQGRNTGYGAQNYQKPYNKNTNWKGAGRGKGQKNAYEPDPRIPRASMPPKMLARRQEQVLLAALINHPAVLSKHLEDLATLRLPSKDFDVVLQELVDAVVREPDLDREALKCQLCDKGYSRLVDELLGPAVLDHGKFARPATDSYAAEHGVSHIAAMFREKQAEREKSIHSREFAANMDETGLAQLEERKLHRQEVSGVSIDLDSYDPDAFEDSH
ncbi:DNA primase [Kiloniella laminariae]|uniref:DNA primase n=1 Tax=Kiloniella laminariae TaxID=454162 RepID=UPI0003AA0832|nr:DNA primase [Kiloniella laminariae]